MLNIVTKRDDERMPMKEALLLTISILSYQASLAQLFPDIVLHRFYDNLGEDIPQRLVKAHDGNLFLGGNTVVEAEWGKDCANVWLLKVDTLGEIIWEEEVRLDGCEELRDLIATEDGGVVFAGVTASLVDGQEQGGEGYGGNYFVGKVDSFGQLEWIQSYGGSQLDQAYGLVEGVYHEYMVIGGTHSHDGQVGENRGMSDLWTLKIDTKGHTRYSQVMGGPHNDWGTAITLSQNGDYLITGVTHEQSRGGHSLGQGWLLRLQQSGEPRWEKTLYRNRGGFLNDLCETPEGDLLLVGHHEGDNDTRDFWWMATNPAGETLWEWHPSGPDDEQLTCVDRCEDGGYILGGYSVPRDGGDPYAKGGEDFWLIRTNRYGQIIWRNTYGGPQHERCTDVVAYRPGVFYAIGEKVNRFTRGDQKANKDFWLVRIEERPADSIRADIFVRAKEYRISRQTPTRFRAIYGHGDRFLWDFGDGTTSRDPEPLKSYALAGTYQVTLTIFANETCRQTVTLAQDLEVW
jgi:hypothetical protein